ncbi:trafficking protein particle complex subunit 33 [Monosporozyma unispora]|nr:Trafficking protein particle complex subunit 33 [Kazachstania unispora]
MPHQRNSSIQNPEALERQRQYELFQESLPKVNALVYQMLLNEIIPLSSHVENQLQTIPMEEFSEDQTESQLKDLSLEEKQVSNPSSSDQLIYKLSQLADEDENEFNNTLKRVRDIGIKLGTRLTNLLVFTNNVNLNFKEMDLLLIMKFICRDVWKQIFGKQIDNLKTNHRGTFYLIDYDYALIQDFCIETNTIPSQLNEEVITSKELKLVEPFLELPVGIIKGVLLSLGYPLEEVICLATFIDKPREKIRNGFPKGISFHVQITKPNQQQ